MEPGITRNIKTGLKIDPGLIFQLCILKRLCLFFAEIYSWGYLFNIMQVIFFCMMHKYFCAIKLKKNVILFKIHNYTSTNTCLLYKVPVYPSFYFNENNDLNTYILVITYMYMWNCVWKCSCIFFLYRKCNIKID